jgi:glycosyltransferase involved in cell wall biosynthesis
VQAPIEAAAMKVLTVAPEPFFTPRGTPFSVYYRTLVAAEQGMQIDLLTYGEGADVTIPGVRIVRIPRFSLIGPVPIGPSFRKLFLDTWMVLWTVMLLVRHRYDVVHAHEESVFWCRYLKPLFGFKLAYDMHSSLPQQLANFRFSNSRLLSRIFVALERSALVHSDAVITICPDLDNYTRARTGRQERLFLIENSIFDDVRLVDGDDSRSETSETPVVTPAGPRVVYAGTFERYQGLELLLEAFAQVRARRPDAELLLVGGRPDQVAKMRALAGRLGIGAACRFTGRVSKRQAGTYLETATVLVSPRIDGTNTPLKIYQQLASGKPLVATRIWSHTQVLTDEVCFLVDPEPATFGAGLLQALNDLQESARRSAAARQLYESAYSRARYEDKMRRFLEVLR